MKRCLILACNSLLFYSNIIGQKVISLNYSGDSDINPGVIVFTTTNENECSQFDPVRYFKVDTLTLRTIEICIRENIFDTSKNTLPNYYQFVVKTSSNIEYFNTRDKISIMKIFKCIESQMKNDALNAVFTKVNFALKLNVPTKGPTRNKKNEDIFLNFRNELFANVFTEKPDKEILPFLQKHAGGYFKYKNPACIWDKPINLEFQKHSFLYNNKNQFNFKFDQALFEIVTLADTLNSSDLIGVNIWLTFSDELDSKKAFKELVNPLMKYGSLTDHVKLGTQEYKKFKVGNNEDSIIGIYYLGISIYDKSFRILITDH